MGMCAHISSILFYLGYYRTLENPRPLQPQAHTILFVQPSDKAESRTYSDYESLTECLEGICKIFEEHLKKMNPTSPSITYDVSQLFDFMDRLQDLSCLVLSKVYGMYEPHNKDWIKEKIYVMLRTQAAN